MLQPKVMLKRLTRKMSLGKLQPRVNVQRLPPQAISLNKVESYGEQNQSQNNVQTMGPSVEPVAGPSGTSTNPLRRSSRLNKDVEPTKNSPRNRAKRSVDTYPQLNPTNRSKRRKVQYETLAQPLQQTQKSKTKRTVDVRRIEIQPTVNEEQRKNAFDLAVGRKKRKTEHTEPPSKLWSSVPLPKKRKKRKGVVF